jgi:hypothetical protein
MSVGRTMDTPASFYLDASIEGRADVLAQSIRAADSATVVFSATAGPLRAALEHAVSGLRVLLLDGALEPAEWDLRLSELMAGVYRVTVLDSRLAWDAQVVITLRRWAPGTVCIELPGVGATGLYEPWAADLLIRRARGILPAAALVLVSAPEGRLARTGLEHIVGALAETRGSAVSPGVPLRFSRVATERHRWSELLRVTSVRASPIVVVTPSRARAVAAASRFGLEAMAYHGGLLESERAKALAAYRRGNIRVLITTQSLPPFEGLPAPGAIVLTHPPHRCEIVPRLAAWLARADVPGPLAVLWLAADMATSRGDNLGLRPHLTDLRSVYRSLRALVRDGFTRVVPESLSEVAGPMLGQPYLAESSLAALETSGLLRREDDIGRLVAVTVSTREPVPTATDLLPTWQVGVPVTMDPVVIASRLGLGPTEWQRRLVEGALDGRLLYRPAGRERLYALIATAGGAASRLQLLVQERATIVANDKRIVERWLTMPTCRVQALAVLLELPAEPICGLCDYCAPKTGERIEAATEPRDIVLRALAEVPIAIPERTAERIARQALSAAGKADQSSGSSALIELLVGQGLVRRETGGLQPRIIVSDKGRGLLAGG